MLNDPGEKPKGMRWRTYNRLCGEQEELAEAGMASLVRNFGLLESLPESVP